MFDKYLATQAKNEIQNIAVKGAEHHLRLLLTWATGCGKTLGALRIIKSDYEKNPNLKGYVICSETNHIDNWYDDIKKHHMKFIYKCSEQFLYASLHKYNKKGFVDFVILDEVHNITPKRLEYLKQIVGPKTRVVMLSATVNDEKLMILKSLASPFGHYNISITEAIIKGIIPIPVIYIHKFKLDDVIKNRSVTLKTSFKDTKTFANLTEQGAYYLMSKRIDYFLSLYELEGKPWQRNFAVNLGSKRKRMMAEFKSERAKELLKKKFKTFRYIVFTGSKLQAETLGRNFVHSGMSKKRNLELKNKFNRGRLKSLVVVNMFREGMNLVNIQKGLIVQLDDVKLSFIQMLGRVFRSEFPEMHIMVFEGTQDEKYLNRVLYGIDKDYIKYINY